MHSKSDIRKLMRQRRNALSVGDQRRASRALRQRLEHHPYFVQARRIGIYCPNDGEIDLMPLVSAAAPKRFHLPILPPRGKLRLWFGGFQSGARLIVDRFGILEPVGRDRVRAEDLDLILLPLVAFDRTGGRIGMGGGYYDASLSFIRRSQRVRPVRVIGAAHHFQQVERIPKDTWDVPLHGVVTDRQFITAEP